VRPSARNLARVSDRVLSRHDAEED